MNNKFWTTCEIAALREAYPRGGLSAAQEALPNRTPSSLYQRAGALGLRAPGQPSFRAQWPVTDRYDDAIRALHSSPPARGAVTELALKIGRPRWWVSQRARDLGLITPRFRELPWTPAEIEVLHETAHLRPQAARAMFKRRGFDRTESAIVVKRKREEISTVLARDDAGLLPANRVANFLGVERGTVVRWIRLYGLRAAPRGTAKAFDEFEIRATDLREWIIAHPARIELAKVPAASRAWFIELLAGRAGSNCERAAA